MQNHTMKAIISTGYGSPEVLELREMAIPSPEKNEVLIRIKASAVTRADGMIRTGTPYIGRMFLGFFKPKKPIPGTGIAGIIEAVGSEVTRFKVGDAVFGETGLTFGAHAEYVSVPEDGVLMTKPEQVSFEEAAPICDGALTSINFLEVLGKIKSGYKVLINGASGSLGTAAIQLAKSYGAIVTGVCSGRNTELVHSLGADHVIDYTLTDFTQTGETYDIIYDTVATSSFSKCRNSLTETGMYLTPVMSIPALFQSFWTNFFGTKKAKFSATGLKPAAELLPLLADVKELMEAGELTSVIDKRYSLDQIAEAHRYVDSGRKRGNVVLNIRQSA